MGPSTEISREGDEGKLEGDERMSKAAQLKLEVTINST